MKKYKKIFIVFGLVIFSLFVNIMIREKTQITLNIDSTSNEYIFNTKRDLLCLFLAYPEYIVDLEKTNQDIYIIMKSGTKILYDDKKTKDQNSSLNYPDLQDMLEELYPLTSIDSLLEEKDPGRIRQYQLLKEIYGYSKNEITQNIINKKAGYNHFQFNKNNDASKNLTLAINEITNKIKTNSKISSFIYPTSGTYNYRFISGTKRLSSHSFGIAIDLASNRYDYWKWTTRANGQKRLSSYPKEIVEIFEKYNFIWGGKWSHFDILHFEYRPELVLKSRYFSNNTSNIWYEGAPYDISKKYIDIIDKKLSTQTQKGTIY